MVPVRERKMGVYIDGSITNLDMARNYDDYKVEDIKRPILILQAKDDKLALYQSLLNGVKRLRNYRLVVFEDGGHLMEGGLPLVPYGFCNGVNRPRLCQSIFLSADDKGWRLDVLQAFFSFLCNTQKG